MDLSNKLLNDWIDISPRGADTEIRVVTDLKNQHHKNIPALLYRYYIENSDGRNARGL